MQLWTLTRQGDKARFKRLACQIHQAGKTSKPNSLSPYLIKMLVVLLINQKDYILANYNIC